MKKNIGFTLIELLAVIVILAIILAIAIPSIKSIIDSTQSNAFINNEKILLKAAKTYAGVNESSLPINIGDTTEITLADLQASDYLNTIKAPQDKTKSCNGYVIITKTDESKYDYTPYLNCQNNIGNSTEDGLVAHYKFDDFQEPTTNLIPNPTVFNTGWTSYSNGNDGAFPTEFNVEGLSLNNRRSWAGAHKGITLPAPGTYTISVWVKVISRTQTSINATLYTAGGGLSDQSIYASWSSDKIGVWQKLQMTKTYTSTNLVLYLICYGGTSAAGYEITAQYTMPQIEQKSYATPFADGVRQGIVKDYSGSGNKAALALNNTPKWTENSKVGDGAYIFNGVNNSIDIYHNGIIDNNSGSFSVCSWIYPGTPTGTWQSIVQNSVGQTSTRQWGIVLDSNMNLQYWATVNSSWGSRLTSNTQFVKDNWYHVCVNHKHNDSISFYINGNLDKSVSVTGSLSYNPTYITIGKRFDAEWYNGTLDDIRIYNRALSGEEIKQIYNSEK